MYLFVEAWTPRATWLALSPQERAEFLERTGGEIAELEARGITSLGAGFTDAASQGGHLAFAVWDCGSREACDELRAAIAQSGWYELFDQVDFGGEVVPTGTVLRHHLELPTES
jgi:hypothetical protein